MEPFKDWTTCKFLHDKDLNLVGVVGGDGEAGPILIQELGPDQEGVGDRTGVAVAQDLTFR